MILSSLQRLVALMDAKKIDAEPMLATGQIDSLSKLNGEQAKKRENGH
jgi:hypothetical protein